MYECVVEFAQSFWPYSSDSVARLDTNMTQYSPAMKLYIIWATLENVEH